MATRRKATAVLAPKTGARNVIDALLGSTLFATACFQTTIHTNVFDAWVSQDLVKHLPKTRVVVMDNATFHQGAEMKKVLEEQGHTLLYLPPYSPDLNPIASKWAQAKAMRRKSPCEIEKLFESNDL